MAIITQLSLTKFRLFEQLQIQPSPHINVISGANATGKTSLLEAIWLLSTGQSFRTPQLEQLIINPQLLSSDDITDNTTNSTINDHTTDTTEQPTTEQNHTDTNINTHTKPTTFQPFLRLDANILINHFNDHNGFSNHNNGNTQTNSGHNNNNDSNENNNSNNNASLIEDYLNSIHSPTANTIHYTLIRQPRCTQLRLNEIVQKNHYNHAKGLPVVLITPDSLQLLGGTPKLRRKLLDWGCFYSQGIYNIVLSRYRLILNQRNASLKKSNPKQQIQQWDESLSKEANFITQARKKYLAELTPIFHQITAHLLHGLNSSRIRLVYLETDSKTESFDTEQAWLQLFEQTINKDIVMQTTRHGPHRADLKFYYDDTSLTQVVSRGQWRIIASAFLLAQALMLEKTANEPPVILLDDFSSELDKVHRNNFVDLIQQQRLQFFISTVKKSLLPNKPFHWINLDKLR